MCFSFLKIANVNDCSLNSGKKMLPWFSATGSCPPQPMARTLDWAGNRTNLLASRRMEALGGLSLQNRIALMSAPRTAVARGSVRCCLLQSCPLSSTPFTTDLCVDFDSYGISYLFALTCQSLFNTFEVQNLFPPMGTTTTLKFRHNEIETEPARSCNR